MATVQAETGSLTTPQAETGNLWGGRTETGLFVETTESADEQRVVSMMAGSNGSQAIMPMAVAGMWGYRHDWGNRNGQHVLNLNWGVINRNTLVYVAIGEGAAGGGKFIGGARYTLHNVAPRDGGVGIWINIEWSNPIRIYVDYLAVNP